MKYKKTIIAIILMIILIPFSLTSAENCKSVLLEIGEKYMFTLSEEETYHLNYDYEVITRDKRFVNENLSVDIIANANNMHIITDRMIIYSDENFHYSILPGKKQIFINDHQRQKDPNEMLKMNKLLFKEVLNKCEVIDCKTYGNNLIVSVVLKSNPYFKLDYLKVTYALDLKKQVYDFIELELPSPFPVEKMKLTINEVKTDLENNFEPAHDYLFENDNSLKKKYADFQIIDNRNINE
ncbi:MAG: hypothetical protein ACOCUT_03635 [bacterium]